MRGAVNNVRRRRVADGRSRARVRSGPFEEKDSIEARVLEKDGDKSRDLDSHVTVRFVCFVCSSLAPCRRRAVVQIVLKDFVKPGVYQKSYSLTGKHHQQHGLVEFSLQVDGTSTAQVFRQPLEHVMLVQHAKYPELPIPIFARRALDVLRKTGVPSRA